MARAKKTAAVPEEVAAKAEKSVEKEESTAETVKAPAAKKCGGRKCAEKKEEAPKAAKTTKKKAAPEATPYEKLVETVRAKAAKAKPVSEFAAEITLTGTVEGKFYVKSAGGTADVQPFDYKGADLYVTADSDTLISVTEGKLSLSDSVEQGKVEMVGRASVMIALRNIIA